MYLCCKSSTKGAFTDLEPSSVLLVVAPGLALELPSSQILLVRPRLVVEGVEKGLRLQLLEQLRVLQDGNLAVWIGLGQAIGYQSGLHCFCTPQPVCGGRQ